MNEMEMRVESCMELDSHANMPVVGKHAYIIAETGKKVDVSPFTPDYKPLTVPLVDATVKYDNPYDGKKYTCSIDGSQLDSSIYVEGNGGNSDQCSKDSQRRSNSG